MGKTTQQQQSSTNYSLTPMQQAIQQSAANRYMPNGTLPSSAPTFDYNNNADLRARGENYVAPFSADTNNAFQATRDAYGAQQPTMDAAKNYTYASATPTSAMARNFVSGSATPISDMARGLTLAGATPTSDYARYLTAQGGGAAGQMQGSADGWSTDANGRAQYQDYNTGINRYMSPYISGVINNGLGFLDTARQRQNLTTNNDSVAKGSFGGTRQAVRNSLDDAAYAAQAQNLITSNLQSGYNSAQGQYNAGFGQGQQALGYNTGVEQGNRAAAAGAGQAYANMDAADASRALAAGQQYGAMDSANNAASLAAGHEYGAMDAADSARYLAAGNQLGNQAMQNQQLTGNDINALNNIGTQQQQHDQSQRDAARASQMQDETYGLNVASGLWGLNPPASSTTNSSTSVPSSAIWGSLASSAASAGASAAMASDERAKTGIEGADPSDALAEIRKLKPKRYEYTDLAKSYGAPEGPRTGFMAQDLEKATGKEAPEWRGGFKGVDLAEHVGRLTHAVQALDEQMRARYGSKKKAA